MPQKQRGAGPDPRLQPNNEYRRRYETTAQVMFPPPPWESVRRFGRLARRSFRLVLRLGCGLLGLAFRLVGSLGGVGALLRGVFGCARLRLRGVLGGVVGAAGGVGSFRLRLGLRLARCDGAHALAVYAIPPVGAGFPRG